MVMKPALLLTTAILIFATGSSIAQTEAPAPIAATAEAGTTKPADPKINTTGVEIDLSQYYRYVNKKCEFSYQVPEPPRATVIWGETEVPIDLPNLPEFGEIGEHVSYHRTSLNGEKFIKFDAYCLYPENTDFSNLTPETLENKMKTYGLKNDLRNLKVKAQKIGEDFIAASMTGLVIDPETEAVTAHYNQYFKGPETLLLIENIYNIEPPQARAFNAYIRDSLIYEARD